MSGRIVKKTPLCKGAGDLQRLDLVDGKASLRGDYFQRNLGVAESPCHGLFLFQGFGLGICFTLSSSSFLSFMKFVFQSHVLVPYESVGFVIGHLVVDGFGFAGIRGFGREILHVSLHDRVVEFLVLSKYIKVFKGKVVQSDVRAFPRPVFEVVDGKSVAENVVGAQKNDVLLPEAGVIVPFGKRHAVANALVIPRPLRKFLGVDHLTPTASAAALGHEIMQEHNFATLVLHATAFQNRKIADALVICIETERCLWSRRFQMINFDIKQVFDEGLRDVLVAENKPEHDRVRNVELVERLDVHRFIPSISLANKSINGKNRQCKQLFRETQSPQLCPSKLGRNIRLKCFAKCCKKNFVKKTPFYKGAGDLQRLDLVDGKACSFRDDVQRETVVAESPCHGLFLFQGFGRGFSLAFGSSFGTPFFLAFMKVKFVSHVLVPYESVGFVIGHLVVDGFGFAGIRGFGREILHVSLHDRVVEFLVLSKYIKVFKGKVVQSDVRAFPRPVFEVVDGKSVAENVVGAQKNDVLLPEAGVIVPFGKRHAVADALVIPRPLRKFLGVDHLHLQIEGAECFSVFVRLPRVNVVADALVLGVVTQDGLGGGAFEMLDLDAEQVFDEGLRDVLVAENESEHDRVSNVELVERLDVHRFIPSVSLANKSINGKNRQCKQLFRETQSPQLCPSKLGRNIRLKCFAKCCKKNFAGTPRNVAALLMSSRIGSGISCPQENYKEAA